MFIDCEIFTEGVTYDPIIGGPTGQPHALPFT